MPARLPAATSPAIDRACDIELPRLVCWRPKHGDCELTRELSTTERSALEAHRERLTHALTPFERNEQSDLAASIGAMFSGFRSMRQTGESVSATITITLAVLREFPAWAIKQACVGIAQGKFSDLDPTWPPNDAQIHAAVSDLVAYHKRRLAHTEELIAAKVIERKPLKSRERDATEWRPYAPEADGKHAQRIAADLAERKARNEAIAQQNQQSIAAE